MALELESALTGAALNERERRVVRGIVTRLCDELGEDLLAVWLYGSRARCDANPAEADPDLRSDVDLMAIVAPACDAGAVSWEVQPRLEAIADAEGDSPVYYSLRIFDTEWLRGRREIRSFFVQEVDRDKLVLAGERLDDLGTRAKTGR